MALINLIIKIISSISAGFTYIYEYRVIYKIVGLFTTRRFKPAKNLHKYAVLIAARNEACVIGNLIDSIRNQDYPSELVDIFVCADNCTDDTAEVARRHGAICYSRNNEKKRTKGYALKYLIEQIKNDYGIETYDGYFVFDADNLLKNDYISRMNDSFDAGEKIVTSYRNSKNFDSNWIAASYSLHWLRTIRFEHRARSFFRLATRIQGTGFLFANELIRDGWKYVTLTEDRAFSADAVVKGYPISYNNDAIFYDEQPTDIKTAMRQRIRWQKGHIQAFFQSGPKLFIHSFGIHKPKVAIMSFDMFTTIFSREIFSILCHALILLLKLISFAVAGKIVTAPVSNTTVSFFEILLMVAPFFGNMLAALYVFVAENKRIIKIKWYKKLWYCITFPLFDIMSGIATAIAFVTRVEWKPIPHNESIKIEDIK
ncbi:MAG: glycosyltransferase [Clostridia bacterium]|nr:glycosyltransferase [Clostridia bacterium]